MITRAETTIHSAALVTLGLSLVSWSCGAEVMDTVEPDEIESPLLYIGPSSCPGGCPPQPPPAPQPPNIPPGPLGPTGPWTGIPSPGSSGGGGTPTPPPPPNPCTTPQSAAGTAYALPAQAQYDFASSSGASGRFYLAGQAREEVDGSGVKRSVIDDKYVVLTAIGNEQYRIETGSYVIRLGPEIGKASGPSVYLELNPDFVPNTSSERSVYQFTKTQDGWQASCTTILGGSSPCAQLGASSPLKYQLNTGSGCGTREALTGSQPAVSCGDKAAADYHCAFLQPAQ